MFTCGACAARVRAYDALMGTKAGEYVLGTHDAELARLGLQHRLWSAQAFALWERAGFTVGSRILDVGCGPGFATFDLAQLVGSTGRIVAIDESQRFIEFLNQQKATRGVDHVHAAVGDVQRIAGHAAVPAGTFDGAYARWVLCFTPDPEAVVAGVARALRPGGAFAVQDYFNYEAMTLAPRGPALTRVVQAVGASWRQRGGDPDLVGRLPALFRQHGLELRHLQGHLRSPRPGEPLWQWPTTFFRNFVPLLVEGGFLTPADQAAYEREWAERTNDPDTFFFAPTVFDVIGVKR